MEIRRNPHIYEINLMTWLSELSIRENDAITLKNIPVKEWKYLKSMGIDIVWLMGMWQRSPCSAEKAGNEPFLVKDCRKILPDFSIDDITGSPYAVYDYIPDPEFGSKEDLISLKKILEEEGLALFLDFVPNHTACDHPWVYRHSDRYVTKALKDKNACDDGFFLPDDNPDYKCVAHGKDPNFPPWSDTAQINYARQDTIDAMVQTVLDLADYCSGLRCDMAMLPVKKIFLKTWGAHLNGEIDVPEFWPCVVDRLRNEGRSLYLIGEVYWGMEKELLDSGLDYVYDKYLYDLMLEGNIPGIREYISSPADQQEKMVRFLENHDESRAFQAFGPDRIENAMILQATLPGMRFWHHGQFEGRIHRVPVQLRRAPNENPENNLISFTENLLREVDHPVFHEGVFKVCDTHGWSDNNSHVNLLAYCWSKKEEKRLLVINFSPFHSQGYVTLPEEWFFTQNSIILKDPLKNDIFKRKVSELEKEGLYVGLEKSDYHFFIIKEEQK